MGHFVALPDIIDPKTHKTWIKNKNKINKD